MSILHIEIKKILEKNNIGFYHVVTEDFGGANFYIGINKKLRTINCYITDDFSSKPVRIINLNDPNERIGELPGGIRPTIIGTVMRQVHKALKMDIFPEYLSYTA